MAYEVNEVNDVIIVGAGIAGLHVGIELLKQGVSCCILEAYHIAGGRIFTFKTKGNVQWESGAGRISLTHTRVLGLLKRYGLHTYPISGDVMYIDGKTSGENHFSELCDAYLAPLRALSPSLLCTKNLGQVIEEVMKGNARHFYQMFPYWSEMHTVRADHALRLFEHEMRSMSGFVGCAEGLSALVDGMVKEFKQRGGTIRYDTKVTAVSTEKDGTWCVEVGDEAYSCKRCVLALPSEAIKRIKGVNMSVLKHLQMNPLLRMYAVFPVSKGVWFSGLPKVVTSDRVRFIIPIDESKGVVMISYTDGNDARFWTKKGKDVQGEVMKRIRALFPDRDIPEPLFFKMHHWKEGCTYWKTGTYDVAVASKASVHPQKGLFVCSESFAEETCWMESALVQAERVLRTF